MAAAAVVVALSCASSMGAGAPDAIFHGQPAYQPGHPHAAVGNDLAGLTAALPFHAPSAHASHRACTALGTSFSPTGGVVSVTAQRPDGSDANGSYLTGDELIVRVNLNLNLASDNALAQTHILLETGATDRTAALNSSLPNNGRYIDYKYVVQEGDHSEDLDYIDMYIHYVILEAGNSNQYNCILPRGADGRGDLARNYDIAVNPLPAAVESVSSPNGTGAYGLGETILVNVTFSKPVVVDTTSGSPTLWLGTGPTERSGAAYVSGNDTASLWFEYTVGPGDASSDLDYAGVESLSLNGATIAGRTGGAANLALPAPGSQGSLSNGTDIAVDHAAPVLVGSGSAVQGSGFTRLETVSAVAALEAGGKQYILAGYNGIELIRVHENGTMQSVDQKADGVQDFPRLNNVNGIDAFKMKGGTYAIAASYNDNGVQLIRVHGNNDTLKGVDSLGGIPGAWRADAFRMGGVDSEPDGEDDTYALVASPSSDTVRLLRIHPNGTLQQVGQTGGIDALVASAFGTGDPMHAIVSGYDNNAVYNLRAHSNGTLEQLESLVSTGGPTRTSTVAAFGLGDTGTYALASYHVSDAIDLIRVDPNGTMKRADLVRNGATGFASLEEVRGIAPFVGRGGGTYILVAAAGDRATDFGSVQVVRALGAGAGAGAGAILPVGSASAAGGDPGFENTGDYRDADTFELGGRTYAALPARTGNAVVLAKLSMASVVSVNSTAPDGVNLPGARINVTVNFGEPVAYSGNPPALLLDVGGGAAANATYLEGNATSALVFNYTVRATDIALDLGYAAMDALSGNIRDLNGTLADPTLPAPGSPASLSGSSGIILDSGAPRPISVTSTSGVGPHGIDDVINVVVTFGENMAVDTTGGTPTLGLEVGGEDRDAEYASVSGGTGLVFRYTVAENDMGALNYRGPSISLNGGLITAADGGGAILALPNPPAESQLAGGSALEVDGVKPGIVNVTSPDENGTYGTGTVVNITVAFTEPVRFEPANTVPVIRLNTGNPSGHGDARCTPGGLDDSLSCSYTVRSGDATADLGTVAGSNLGSGAMALDAARNELASVALPASPAQATLGGSKNIALDTSVPAVLRVTSPNGTGPHDAGSEIHVRVVFDGDVTIDPAPIDGDASVPTLRLETGEIKRAAVYAGGSGSDTLRFVYTVNAGDYTLDLNYTGTDALTLGHRALVDEYSNRERDPSLPDPASANSLGGEADIAVRTVPTVVSVGSNSTGPLKVGRTVGVDVVFSEKVWVDPASGDGVPHIELETGRDVRGLAVYSSGSGTHTLTFSYPVNHTDNMPTLDYAGVEALKNNSAQIRGVGELDADLTLPELGPTTSLASASIRLLPNEAPSIVDLPPRSAPADRPARPLVVLVTATDPEMEAVTYSLVEPIPAGAAINAETGRLTWAPTEAQRLAPGNPYNITVLATDPHGANDTAWFVVTVVEPPPPGYTGPVISAIDDVSASEGEAIRFNISATGGRGPYAYSIVADAVPPPPAGAIVHSNGTFSWTPNYEQNGTHAITAIVHGYFSYNHTQTFTVTVADAEPPWNRPPAIEPVDRQSVDEGERLVIQVSATDADVPITYSLPGDPPDGAAIHPATGVFTWEIGYDAAGTHNITVSVADRYNRTSTMSFTVVVADREEPNLPPEIGPIPALRATVGEALELQVNATDPNKGDTLTFGLAELHPRGAAITTGGLFTWTPSRGQVGNHTLNVTVTDDRNLSDWAPLVVTVADLVAVPAEAEAVFAGPRTVRIDYTAPLGPPIGHEGSLYGSVSMAGGGSAEPASVSGLGTRTHIVRLAGDAAGASQGGTIQLLAMPEGVVNGTLYTFSGGSIPVGAGESARTLSPPGVAAPVVAIERNGFIRALNATAAGDSARAAINVSALAVGVNTTLPSDARVAIITSFAEVSFPPNANATGVPADGLIELYVSARAPTAQEIADGLGIDEADVLDVRRVVEAGDNATRIEFHLPVRILLAGQADGRVFYVGGANGTVVPITRVCDADDTDVVDAQLKRSMSGECQLDSDDGEDKIIYTYHLTRFGTAQVAEFAGVDSMCAAALSPPGVPLVAAEPGGQSTGSQAVVSAGRLPFVSVSVGADGAWTDADGGGMVMPASATSVMAAGGAWTPLGGAEPVALQVDASGRSASAEFRVDVPRDALQAGTTSPVDASQAVTYTVMCAAPSD